VEADWALEEQLLALNPRARLICVDGTTSAEIIRGRALREMRKALLRFRVEKFIRTAKLLRKAKEFDQFFARHEFLKLMVSHHPGPGLVTLDALLRRIGSGSSGGRALLKIDIEGAEYDVLADAAERLTRVTAIVVEFHCLDSEWARFETVMRALSPTFFIAHVHGNNSDGYISATKVPVTLEVTLMNRDLVAALPPISTAAYPLPGLDNPNQRRRPDLAIGFD
jgi:hypothetical protein